MALTEDHFREHLLNVMQDGYPVRLRTAGSSMQPTIHSGDFITVMPIDVSRIRRGDIVAYTINPESTDMLAAHRVWKIFKEEKHLMFLVCGDGQSWTEGCGIIPAERIRGIVTQVEHEELIRSFTHGPAWALHVFRMMVIRFCRHINRNLNFLRAAPL